MPTPSIPVPATADAIVVGGGTVGAWCACFLRQAGLDRVVLIEKDALGQGASSRAAGVVRVQGGTPEAVRLGRWSREFYRRQRDEIGADSGFVAQGYLLPCFTEAQVAAARERMAMQTALGLPVRWLDPAEVDAANPTLAPGQTLGGTFCDEDGYITPPRNVAAYTVALARSGVEVAEHVAFRGLLAPGGRVSGVSTSAGPIQGGLVVLTGGPKLAQVGRVAGIRIPAGGVRHQVAVTERHPDLDPARVPMVFDVAAGLYWRPEEGGLLFGMSNPDEPPGDNRAVDEQYLALMRARLASLVPVTAGLPLRRIWAATIDFTPDHLPIIGPALTAGGPLDRVTVASAGGAGMMWGPAVARDHRRAGRVRSGPGPVRRVRPQQAGHRPDRAALPRTGVPLGRSLRTLLKRPHFAMINFVQPHLSSFRLWIENTLFGAPSNGHSRAAPPRAPARRASRRGISSRSFG
jgi:glycine/D-amino acid oxidase-like deaminating enzyme